jgi:hypothetical protein
LGKNNSSVIPVLLHSQQLFYKYYQKHYNLSNDDIDGWRINELADWGVGVSVLEKVLPTHCIILTNA